MHKNATKYNKILSKWCKNKHGASKIIDMFETYHLPRSFFIILNRCMYERRVSSFLCMQDLTSSSDAGRLYVEQNFCVNWLSTSPQLPMESLGKVLNQDRAAPVRCSYKLCITIALVPPSICTAWR
jgi:hypothetical protein